MSLDKAVLHKKEFRKPYRGAERYFTSCRNHGDCAYCEQNRRYKFRDKHPDKYIDEGVKAMDRIDEIIDMFENAECPKEYKNCPLFQCNDCDNYCPFVEAADMLKDYKKIKSSDQEI